MTDDFVFTIQPGGGLMFALCSPIIFSHESICKLAAKKNQHCPVFLCEHFASTARIAGILQIASNKN
jgi:hypothetical protein